MVLPRKHHITASIYSGSARAAVVKHVIDPRQQVPFVIRLAEEEVGPALQPFDNVIGTDQRGQQNDGYVLERGVGLDRAAEAEAVQFRHHDVADDQGWLFLHGGGQSLPAVRRRRYAIAMFF